MSKADHSTKEKYKLIAWPTPQDYQEAIQSPSASLSDEVLQSGETELNSLGLPRPRTGNFACVYKIKCADKEYAVRFFLNNIIDQHQRYRALSDALNGDDLDYTVEFEYEPKGVRVYGNWFPALKMLWVEGEPLDQYINRHHYSQEKMFDLLEQFATMMRDLKEHGIAHGDLQHGNILVASDGLRLVDYDGMFVPALKGHGSNELGHRNYQHPARSCDHFGPYLDNFSAWTIYASLEAITIDPSTWEILKGGDECLLFRATDFQDPAASRAFGLLAEHPCDAIRERCAQLQSFLQMTPDQVPFLTFDDQTRSVIDTERKKHYHEERWYEQSRVWFEKDAPAIDEMVLSEQATTNKVTPSRSQSAKSKLQLTLYRSTLFGLGCILILHSLNSWRTAHYPPIDSQAAKISHKTTPEEQLASLPISFSMTLENFDKQSWVRPETLPVYLASSKRGNSAVVIKQSPNTKQLEALQFIYNGTLKGIGLDYPPGRCNFRGKHSDFANVYELVGTSHAVKWKRSESTLDTIDVQKLILDDLGSTLSDATDDFNAHPSYQLAPIIPTFMPTMTMELHRLAQKAWDESRTEDSLFCYYMIYKLEAAAKLPNSRRSIIECLTKMRGCARQLGNSTLLTVLSCKSIPYYELQTLNASLQDKDEIVEEVEIALVHLTDIYLECHTINQSRTALKSIDVGLSKLAQSPFSSLRQNGRSAFESSWQYVAESATRMLAQHKTERRSAEALLSQLKTSYFAAPTTSKQFCLRLLGRLEREDSSKTVGKLLTQLKSK